MKFIDTRGREHSIDIRPSRWKRKDIGRGIYQTKIGEILAKRFPGDIILEEFPVLGERLSLDFFLPRRKLAVEVQGRQHYQFNNFFHKDKEAFINSTMRDRRKEEWCDINKIQLIKIDWGAKEESVLELLP